MTSSNVYVFDTSSLRVLRNYYPQRFPTLWRLVDGAATSGLIVSVREAHTELLQQIVEPWLLGWIETNRHLFRAPSAAETAFVARIFAVPHFQTLVGEKQRLQGNPVADPFVIAAASIRGAIVVSEEVLKPNGAKIPNVCQHFGIDFVDLEGFMGRNGWQF